MTTAPHRLKAVQVREDGGNLCTLVCQATLSGPQLTSVRALSPITGPGGPHIGVRVGSVLLLIADRQALRSVLNAMKEAELLADTAYGTRGD